MVATPTYYDWQKTLSYDADFTCVTGGRGIGKTYGLRKQFVADWAKDGSHFVEVVRYADQLKGDDRIQNGYFDKLELDPDVCGKWVFKTQGVRAYIAAKPSGDDKPDWQLFGYFIALTQANKLKQRTFVKVKRILMDEGIIDPLLGQYQRYLTGEFELLMNIVDTVSRERPDTESIRPRVYVLGNAVDLLNPYYAAMGVGDEPKRGYSWYRGKTMLLHYPEAAEYAEAKAAQTVAGRLLAGSGKATQANIYNEFVRHDAEFFGKRPGHAKWSFGIYHKGKHYGVWLDAQDGYYYVDNKIPNNAEPVFTLTAEDSKPNYVMAKRMQKSLKGFVELYYMGIVKYNNESTRDGFIQALTLFGVR